MLNKFFLLLIIILFCIIIIPVVFADCIDSDRVPIELVSKQQNLTNNNKDIEYIHSTAFNESFGIRISYTVASFGHGILSWLSELW